MEDCRIAWLMAAAAKSEEAKALSASASAAPAAGSGAADAARSEAARRALDLLDGSRQARQRQLAALREASGGGGAASAVEPQDKVGVFELLLEFELALLLRDTSRCADVLRRAEKYPAFGAANLRRLAKLVFTTPAEGGAAGAAGAAAAAAGDGGEAVAAQQQSALATANLQLAVLEACLRASLNSPGSTAADNWCASPLTLLPRVYCE